MKEIDDHKLLTLIAYNNSVQEFAKNTEALHPEEKAKKILNLLPGNRILDLGCGPGRDAKVFVDQGFQVVGVDLSPQMIEMAHPKFPRSFQSLVEKIRKKSHLLLR